MLDPLVTDHLQMTRSDQSYDRPKAHTFEAGLLDQCANGCDAYHRSDQILQDRVCKAIGTSHGMNELRIVQLDRANILFREQTEVIQKTLADGLLFDACKLFDVLGANPLRRTHSITDRLTICLPRHKIDIVRVVFAVFVVPFEPDLLDQIQRRSASGKQQDRVDFTVAVAAHAYTGTIAPDETTREVPGRTNLGGPVATAEFGKADTAGLEVIGHVLVFQNDVNAPRDVGKRAIPKGSPSPGRRREPPTTK